MGMTTVVRQLLKSLCHNTRWNYAVLWKLRRQNNMLLTWEDWYFDGEKSGGYLSVKPQAVSFGSFGCEMDTVSGTSPRCPIEVAVNYMSYQSYPLGEGRIVGEVASRRKHHWTFSSEYVLQPQFPEEWQLQFEAGIKTFLLVPVIPLGVVQLGSLETVLEDLSEVVHISDLFRTIQQNAGTCISSSSRMTQLDVYTSFAMPSVENYDGLHSQVSVENYDDLHSQVSLKKDFAAPEFDVATENGIPSSMSHFPPSMAQTDLPLPMGTVEQILGVSTSTYTDESIWKSEGNDLFHNDIGGPHQINQSSADNYNIIEGDLSIFTCLEDKVNIHSSINHSWASEQSIMSNPYMKDLGIEEYDYRFENEIDGSFFSFPFDCELQKALGIATLKDHEGCEWDTILSKADEWGSSASVLQTEIPEVYSPTFEEADRWLTRGTEQLLDAAIAEFLNASDDNNSGVSRCIRSCSNSSCKSGGSCLTQSKADDNTLGFEDSLSLSHKRSAPSCEKEYLIASPTRSSEKSALRPSVQEQHTMAHGIQKRGIKSSYSNRNRSNTGNIHRPKPRDRQLIQDRIKELRELIPNSSKSSIDALLDQTVKHMMFLQSIPSQAEKLKNSEQVKVKGEEWSSSAAHACESGTSWVYELGRKSTACPLTVESLDEPGQILIEMQCKEYALFLDIAQVIKRLQLSILKGILESRSEEQWAHFIVETPKGFHRMDILWPLVQLLQRNNTPIPILC
ncbi:transcription factor EMB1444-like [Iris pallida]|uniref:Transcription factor EMB1444-like n=1 Tax=Iris pallida TaxID=29817 RepID=A0AAX6HLE4_IRIPA|nr:transcription factor EMB1444-like [Iris pallida]